MTVEEMKIRKREKGYSYEQIAELSGVPLGTIQKIFSGVTANPRYETLQALERLFSENNCVQESVIYKVDSEHKQGSYTINDYRALPDEQRVELIDGYFYDMASPTYFHQMIAGEVYRQIANYIYEQNGLCQPLVSPIDVQLDCDEKTMVQPDVVILCDRDKAKKWGIFGSPDFVLEVISPATKKKDCMKKLGKYEKAGVREYWIVDPYQEVLLVYFFESESCPVIYGLNQSVPIGIYDGKLQIEFSRIAKWVEESKKD